MKKLCRKVSEPSANAKRLMRRLGLRPDVDKGAKLIDRALRRERNAVREECAKLSEESFDPKVCGNCHEYLAMAIRAEKES